MSSPARVVRRFAALLVVVAASLPGAGCYTYHVYQVGGPQGRELGNQPSTEWRRKTLHSFFWGGIRQDLPVSACQSADGQRFGIEEVKVDTNLAYVLVSAATLGIWVPLNVGYRCAKPGVTTGVLR